MACLLGVFAYETAPLANARPWVIDWKPSAWHHVRFEGKPATHYAQRQDQLWAEVAQSSSFLLLPFEQPRRVSQLSFEYKLEGRPRVHSAAQEETRAGDDLPLRVGLLLEGPEPRGFLGLGVPGWVKQVRGALKHESNRVLFLVAGSRHLPGARWSHPGSGDIEQRAVTSVAGEAGWQRASVALEHAASVVGLWIMADGDDTQSSYRTGIRHLTVR